MTDALQVIKSPRTKMEREAEAWGKAMDGLTPNEQWLLELVRHGRTERIEEFIDEVHAGREKLAEPKQGFVNWRSRGIIDPDIAAVGADAIRRDIAAIADAEPIDWPPTPWSDPAPMPTELPEAQVETSQYPHLYKLFRP